MFETLRSVIFVGAHLDKFEKRRDKLGPNVIANMESALGLGIGTWPMP